MRVFTIGFTKKSAERFFELLRGAGVRRVVDVRLRNESQLAGFAKKDDLAFFLRELAAIEYVHLPLLAPTAELLDAYRGASGGWAAYERAFSALIEERRIEAVVSKDVIAEACLLCSEASPRRCHRRLVAEHLKAHWHDLEVVHLE